MIPTDKLIALIDRHEELEAGLATAPSDQIATLSKEYSDLGPVVEGARRYLGLISEIQDLAEMTADKESDAEMRRMAEDEMLAARAQIPDLEDELQILLLPKDAADERNAIVEIRAGTGGDEAALFAGDLFRMYQRYADLRKWKMEILSSSEGEMGGYKEVISSISGAGVFARLKFESGVHRVQRVPETESSGRVHTSAATVAVLPEAEEVDIEIRQEDIRIDTMRASGAGGQHVNTTDSAVRMTHIPTGVMVTSSEKSQHQNRAKAMVELRTRLYDMERQKLDNERAGNRKSQVGSGDRSERIRTYNFPQGRVSDHRINLTLYNLDKLITGDELDKVIDPLIAEDQATRLAEMNESFG